MHFQSSYKKSAKTKDKEKRLCIGNSELSPNQPAVQRTYESWLRIWNPELFHIPTRRPCLLLFMKRGRHGPPHGRRLCWRAASGSREPGGSLASASHWPRPALAVAGCSHQQQELELCSWSMAMAGHILRNAVRARMASREWRTMWR